MRRCPLPSDKFLLAAGPLAELMAETDRLTVPITGLRIYGPGKALSDKTWRLLDFEKT
jgi:hypothetical protein